MVSNVEPLIYRKSDTQQGLHLQGSERTVLRDSGSNASRASGQEVHRYNSRTSSDSGQAECEAGYRGKIIGILTEQGLRAIRRSQDTSSPTCCRSKERKRGLRLLHQSDNSGLRVAGCYTYPKGANFVGQVNNSGYDSDVRSVRVNNQKTQWLIISVLAVIFAVLGKTVIGAPEDAFALGLEELQRVVVKR